MVRLLTAALLLLITVTVWADGLSPAWNDGFESGNIANYVRDTSPAGASLVLAGRDGGYALRLAPGKNTWVVLKEFAVEPGVKYRLSFSAKADGPDILGRNPDTAKLFFEQDKTAMGLRLPGWEIRVVNAANQVPYTGYLKYFWQYCCQGDWSGYNQSFYTPADAVKVQVIFFNPGSNNMLLVDDVKLEKSTDTNLLASGDVFNGPYDYSGWSELSKASLFEADGKFKLVVSPGGYALTDRIPVTPGDYLVSGKRPMSAAFFYDADQRRIGRQSSVGNKVTVPQGAAYLQFFFGAGEIESLTMTLPTVKR